MLRVGVMVSGGGTNLQAILDSIDNGTIRNARVEAAITEAPTPWSGPEITESRRSASLPGIMKAENSLTRPFLRRSMNTSWISLCWRAFW